MIREMIVEKSGRQGTVFEGGWSIPYAEMKGIYKKGEKVLLYVSEDEKVVSAKIYNYMQDCESHRVGDTVPVLIYEMKPEMGAFAAVEDRYHGLIPLNEIYREVKVGSRMEARVTKIDQGKMRLSIRKRAADQLETDMESILYALAKGGGVLYLTDNTEADIIKRKLNMSKKAYKRAVGRLLSKGEVVLGEDCIEAAGESRERREKNGQERQKIRI